MPANVHAAAHGGGRLKQDAPHAPQPIRHIANAIAAASSFCTLRQSVRHHTSWCIHTVYQTLTHTLTCAICCCTRQQGTGHGWLPACKVMPVACLVKCSRKCMTNLWRAARTTSCFPAARVTHCCLHDPASAINHPAARAPPLYKQSNRDLAACSNPEDPPYQSMLLHLAPQLHHHVEDTQAGHSHNLCLTLAMQWCGHIQHPCEPLCLHKHAHHTCYTKNSCKVPVPNKVPRGCMLYTCCMLHNVPHMQTQHTHCTDCHWA